MIAVAALLVQSATAPPPPAAPAPRAPSVKRTVDQTASACILSHDDGTTRTTVGTNGEVILLVRGRTWATDRRIEGRSIMQPSGRSVESLIETFNREAKDVTLITLKANAAVVTALEASTAVIVETMDGRRRNFALPGKTPSAMPLGACQNDLPNGFGASSQERAEIDGPDASATSARTNSAEWIAPEDYPADALIAHKQRTSIILWSIGVDGRVHDCFVVASSGASSLDRASCSAITAQGRYIPATDKNGVAVVSHAMRRVVWRIPG